MTPFLFAASFMCLLAVALIIFPLYKSKSYAIDRTRINVELFKERLQELSSEKDRGLIDDEQFSLAIEELEEGLLIDLPADHLVDGPQPKIISAQGNSKRYTIIFCVLVIPLASFLLYFQLGNFEAEKRWGQLKKDINPALMGLERGEDTQADIAKYNLGDVIAVLQARLQQGDETPQGWLLLGLLYAQANNTDVAINAFERAMLLAPNHPEIKIAYAETLIRQNDGRLTQVSAGLLKEVLEKNSNNTRALMLMGMGSYNSGFYEQSIAVWEKLLEVRGGSSDKAPLLRQSIQMARQAMVRKAEPSQGQDQGVAGSDVANVVARLQQLVMRDRRMTDEIERLLKEVFSVQPDNSRALAFQGMLSFNAGQYKRAINSWERLLKQREPGSERAQLIESSILKAKVKLESL
ncbi:MAG: c-type cytochrome biogenesis protein CcmI [Pseudomonadales bacterium]|nr:c-type cytochrome biogenesis protein CcmI [Pseudomonadales bacterium]